MRTDPFPALTPFRLFITPQSVDAVITEEKAKAAKANAEPLPQPAESFRTLPHNAEPKRKVDAADSNELAELKRELRDLEITNRSKDIYIDRMTKDREEMLQRLVESSHKVGQLESKRHAEHPMNA